MELFTPRKPKEPTYLAIMFSVLLGPGRSVLFWVLHCLYQNDSGKDPMEHLSKLKSSSEVNFLPKEREALKSLKNNKDAIRDFDILLLSKIIRRTCRIPSKFDNRREASSDPFEIITNQMFMMQNLRNAVCHNVKQEIECSKDMWVQNIKNLLETFTNIIKESGKIANKEEESKIMITNLNTQVEEMLATFKTQIIPISNEIIPKAQVGIEYRGISAGPLQAFTQSCSEKEPKTAVIVNQSYLGEETNPTQFYVQSNTLDEPQSGLKKEPQPAQIYAQSYSEKVPKTAQSYLEKESMAAQYFAQWYPQDIPESYTEKEPKPARIYTQAKSEEEDNQKNIKLVLLEIEKWLKKSREAN